MEERRAAAHRAVAEALPWRYRLDGVIALVLDYAARKPIAFPVTSSSSTFHSDGVTASMLGPSPRDSDGLPLFPARCAFPLAVCVPSWSVYVCVNVNQSFALTHVGIGVVETRNLSWVDLTCPASMHSFDEKYAVKVVGDVDESTYYHVQPWLDNSVSDHHESFRMTMPLGEAHVAIDSGRLGTVHIAVDLEAETIAWTVYGGQTVSCLVPNLCHMFAYVDLSPGYTARIIQHPHPWLF